MTTRRREAAPRRGPRARGEVSLARALSKRGLCSRAEATALIVEGRVRVDGVVCRDPSRPVVPERVAFAIDGTPAAHAEWRALLLHKPRGTVTTRRDPEGRPTVFDVLGPAGAGLQAVGRLDLASSGLLVLTNDTRWAAWLTDPATGIVRTYAVSVRGEVADPRAGEMERGVDVPGPDGTERLQAARVTIRKRSRRETHLVVELTEGRNREVRRLCAAVGHPVTRLVRTAFGPLVLADLASGTWRELTREEAVRAFPGAPFSTTVG